MRCSAFAFLLASLSLVSISARSGADDNLTIDLPQSPQAAASAAPKETTATSATLTANNGAAGPVRHASSSGPISTKKFGSRGGKTVNGTTQYTVGRLGVATQTVSIRAGRGNSRPVLSKVQSGTYMALNCENGPWYGVLMADRTTGWVRKSDVKMLDYEVVSDRKNDAAAYTSNNVGSYAAALLTGGQKAIIEVAQSFLGVPYKWGGTSPNGMDCSAFVQRCFSSVGINLPRTAREQCMCGAPVSSEQLQACDRLYFANSSGEIVHTGIYLGNGYFIHASGKLRQVGVSRLDEDLYVRMYAGARR